MSIGERDPFEALKNLPEPKRDSKVMQAAIAEGRTAFEQRKASALQEPPPKSWTNPGKLRWDTPLGILMPAGAAIAAGLVAFIVLPGLLTPTEPQTASPAQMAEAQPVPSKAPNEGVRMGARPMPARPLDADLSRERENGPTVFEQDGLRLEWNVENEKIKAFLLTEAARLPLPPISLAPGQSAKVIDAFKVPQEENLPGAVAVQIQLSPEETTAWNVYLLEGGGAQHDQDLSALLSGAPDRTEAERRIDNARSRDPEKASE